MADKKDNQNKSKRTTRFSDMLLQVTNDLAKTKSLDEALETLVKITTSTIGAERGTIFLNDASTGELYSRIAQGNFRREIRILNTKGVAGWVFSKNQGVIIHDAYKDERFNKAVDVRTGFRTKSILCAPLRTVSGEKIGVSQILNKVDGEFKKEDLDLLEAMTEQAAIAIQGNIIVEQIEAARKQELEFLDVVSQVSSELELTPLLQKIITTISTMLDCERATLFINDEKTNELYTEVGEGLDEKSTIRIPNHLGISGTVFTSGKAVNIPHAYADLRFNPSFDKQTGFFTRSILCMPVFSKAGKAIGVSQVLNKRGGAFNAEDEKRLAAFTSQISMGIENAKLFDDVQSQMNYSQSILSSMHDAVLTLDENGVIKTCNPAGLRILKIPHEAAVLEQQATVLFGGPNEWLLKKLEAVNENEEFLDAELQIEAETLSVNITLTPLLGKIKSHPIHKMHPNQGKGNTTGIEQFDEFKIVCIIETCSDFIRSGCCWMVVQFTDLKLRFPHDKGSRGQRTPLSAHKGSCLDGRGITHIAELLAKGRAAGGGPGDGGTMRW